MNFKERANVKPKIKIELRDNTTAILLLKKHKCPRPYVSVLKVWLVTKISKRTNPICKSNNLLLSGLPYKYDCSLYIYI